MLREVSCRVPKFDSNDDDPSEDTELLLGLTLTEFCRAFRSACSRAKSGAGAFTAMLALSNWKGSGKERKLWLFSAAALFVLRGQEDHPSGTMGRWKQTGQHLLWGTSDKKDAQA